MSTWRRGGDDVLANRMQMAAAGAGGLSEDLLPWLVNVDVFMTFVDYTYWNLATQSGGLVYNAWAASASPQYAEINFDVVLAAGTWTFEMIHRTASDQGIATLKFDGTSKGTIDCYSAGTVDNVRSQITGIAVATSGKVRLKLRMETKNASSSGYNCAVSHIQLKRTA